MSGRLDIGRITVCRFSSPSYTFRIFFAQNVAGNHRLDGFPTWSMYVWYIRSNQRRFKPNLTCWAVGWKSVASQNVDVRPPDPHFGFFLAQNVAGKHRLDGFPTWSTYLWCTRSNEKGFNPNLTSLAAGWISVASQYVDFRHPDSHFGFFSLKMLRENIVSMVFLLDLCNCDII